MNKNRFESCSMILTGILFFILGVFVIIDRLTLKKGDVDRAVRHRIGSAVEGDGGDVAREKLVSDRDIAFNDLSRRSGDFLPFDRHLVLDR